ncbi:hypothetical protein BKA57DRAFT_457304 [Linnemannia elongata]|nr:hypothetical protein BKA57DRAFT_457304 [Linnemannia elongata]
MDYVVTVDPDGVGRIIYNIKALIMKTTLGLFAHLVVFACPMQSPLSKTICWISPFQRSCLRAFRMVNSPFLLPGSNTLPCFFSPHCFDSVVVPFFSSNSLSSYLFSPHSFPLVSLVSFPYFSFFPLISCVFVCSCGLVFIL